LSIINNEDEVLHKLEARLYPNYLGKGEGAYVARSKPEAPLSVENICVSAKNRGGYTGNLSALIEHSNVFFNEMVYQLLDGYSVQILDLFAICPRISGSYNSERDTIGSDKVRLSFRALGRLKGLLAKVKVQNMGIAGDGTCIDKVTDVTTGALNGVITPKGIFRVDGSKIKVYGDNIECGVYFVKDAPGPIYREKVQGNLADNTSTRITGIVPNIEPGRWKVQVVTQYSGSGGILLKAPRAITSTSVLTVA
jgi:hypothetical protein